MAVLLSRASLGLAAYARRAPQGLPNKLFEYLCAHPEELPPELADNRRHDSTERRVADYIAGMTDRYAIQVFERFYVPGPWAVIS